MSCWYLLIFIILHTKKIVITGGPSTGKTTVINKLEEKGFTCLHEIIRDMTQEEKTNNTATTFVTNPIVSVTDPMAFNTNLLNARVAQYESVKTQKSNLIFFDRGIPDILAYMDCFEQSYDSNFIEACTNNTYDTIFMMPPWREIHIVDNERFESYDESLRVNNALIKTYTHFGYDIQIVPRTTIDKRVSFILEQLNTSL